MKPRNFPARKLARQLAAKYGVNSLTVRGGYFFLSDEEESQLEAARSIRSKKFRGR